MSHSQYIIDNPPKRKPIVGEKAYQCSIKITTKGVEKTYGFDLLLDYDENFFSWKKSNFTINNTTLFSKTDRLYTQLKQPINNVLLGCKNGRVKKISQERKITKAWQKIKSKLEAEFNGEVLNQLIPIFDNRYQNPELLIPFLQQDPILQLFYRSFLDDALVYQGYSYHQHLLYGFNRESPITLKGKKTLTFRDNMLYLQYQSESENTKEQNVIVNVTDAYVLNYKTVWIEQATTTIEDKTNHKTLLITLKSKM